jgi:transcriptional regulator with XRE-family HTH domain
MKYKNLSTDMILQRMAENLNTRRKIKGYTYDSLADASSVSPKTIQNFLSNKSDIKLSTLIGLLKSIDALDALNTLIDPHESYSPVRDINKRGAKRHHFSTKQAKIEASTKAIHNNKKSKKSSEVGLENQGESDVAKQIETLKQELMILESQNEINRHNKASITNSEDEGLKNFASAKSAFFSSSSDKKVKK